jgi:hypothetical protein
MGNRKKTESTAEIIDKIFAQVDPIVAAGGLLCAASTSLGIMPPLTSIVNALSNKEVQSTIADALTWSPVSAGIGMITGGNISTSWADLLTGNYGSVSESDRDKARRHQGMIFLGAFEGMLLMSVARNEAALNKIMELGGKLGSATITAAGEAVPF